MLSGESKNRGFHKVKEIRSYGGKSAMEIKDLGAFFG
jgi:hypothetical protein